MRKPPTHLYVGMTLVSRDYLEDNDISTEILFFHDCSFISNRPDMFNFDICINKCAWPFSEGSGVVGLAKHARWVDGNVCRVVWEGESIGQNQLLEPAC